MNVHKRSGVFGIRRPLGQAKGSMRKQVSFFLPLTQWVLIRNEAIRQGIPITELCRRWMSDEMRKLETSNETSSNSSQPQRRP